MSGWPYRVSVVMPYWSFWEASAPGHDLAAERRQLLADAATSLEHQGLEVVATGLLASPADAARFVADESDADVAVVVITMAAPPSHTVPVVEAGLPVVVWAVDLGLGATGSMVDIVQDGATVGTPQLTNVLVRHGQPFSLASGQLDTVTAARTALLVRAEALANEFPSLRIARVGTPIPGYLSVDADDHGLVTATGLQILRRDSAELQQRAAETDPRTLDELGAETAEIFDPGQSDPDLARSLAFVAGLRTLVDELGVAAGTLNCHVPELRFDPDHGVAPCLALGDATSRGVPWTCTGDVVTAIAMLAAKRLTGAALYHEIETLDPTSGEAVLANSGEHDLAWCPADHRPRLRSNPWFATDPHRAASAWFPLRPGPATLIGFTPAAAEPSGHRFVAAEGAILDRHLDDSPTVGGLFRFEGSDGRAAWERWVRAGVNHHSALAMGHAGLAVRTLAERLDVGAVQVS